MPTKKYKKGVGPSEKAYKRMINNKMHSYGDIDWNKREIRINKNKSRKTKGGIVDTIQHEEIHRIHPKMGERAVKRKTSKDIKHMSSKQKSHLFSMYG